MPKKSRPQYASVEMPIGAGLAYIHCPVCGHPPPLRTPDGREPEACPHLVFIYHAAFAVFAYETPAFLKKRTELGLPELEEVEIRPFLERAGYDNRLLAIEVTYLEIGGPMIWQADVYGFDFGADVEAGKEARETRDEP